MQLWGSFGLVVHKNKIILQQRNDPGTKFHKKWALPGGIIQFGEHPKETLIRRALEEIGIYVEVTDMIPIVQNYVDEDKQLLLLFYLAKTTQTKLQNLDDHDDILDVKWVDIKDIPKVPLLRGTRDPVKLGLRMLYHINNKKS